MKTVKSSHMLGIIATGIVAGILYTTLLFGGCSPDKEPASNAARPGHYTGKIKVGHLVALDMAPMFVAKEAGFFKENDLDVETIFFPNPGDNNAALAGGAIQFSINPFTLPYLGANSGVPIRIISSAGGLGIMQVVIQGEYGVENSKQLQEWVRSHPNKKLKVGTLKGDTLDVILYRYFGTLGLTYNDFEMVWFNDLLAMVDAFKTKQVDILSHIKPYTTSLVVKQGAKVLTDNSEVWGEGTPNCTTAVMDEFLNKYPETVKSYLRAVRKGFQLIVDDPHKAVDLLTHGNYYKVDPEVLLYAFENQPKKVVLRPNVSGMNIAIDDMVKLGYIKHKPSGDIVRLEPLDDVEKGP